MFRERGKLHPTACASLASAFATFTVFRTMATASCSQVGRNETSLLMQEPRTIGEERLAPRLVLRLANCRGLLGCYPTTVITVVVDAEQRYGVGVALLRIFSPGSASIGGSRSLFSQLEAVVCWNVRPDFYYALLVSMSSCHVAVSSCQSRDRIAARTCRLGAHLGHPALPFLPRTSSDLPLWCASRAVASSMLFGTSK
jgi:hypothetical protein